MVAILGTVTFRVDESEGVTSCVGNRGVECVGVCKGVVCALGVAVGVVRGVKAGESNVKLKFFSLVDAFEPFGEFINASNAI